MPSGADAVPTPSPVASVRQTPDQGQTSPISAPKSSSSTTGSSGAFACRMNCTHSCRAAERLDS